MGLSWAGGEGSGKVGSRLGDALFVLRDRGEDFGSFGAERRDSADFGHAPKNMAGRALWRMRQKAGKMRGCFGFDPLLWRRSRTGKRDRQPQPTATLSAANDRTECPQTPGISGRAAIQPQKPQEPQPQAEKNR